MLTFDCFPSVVAIVREKIDAKSLLEIFQKFVAVGNISKICCCFSMLLSDKLRLTHDPAEYCSPLNTNSNVQTLHLTSKENNTFRCEGWKSSNC